MECSAPYEAYLNGLDENHIKRLIDDAMAAGKFPGVSIGEKSVLEEKLEAFLENTEGVGKVQVILMTDEKKDIARVTGNKKYMDQAKYFVDARGVGDQYKFCIRNGLLQDIL